MIEAYSANMNTPSLLINGCDYNNGTSDDNEGMFLMCGNNSQFGSKSLIIGQSNQIATRNEVSVITAPKA